jgi:aminopeptidase N
MIWAGYTVIAVVCLALAVYLAWNFISYDQLCDEKQTCVQQWFSALSGWAGALATIITLLLLRQQIQDANRHHRQALHAEHHGTIGLAQRIFEDISELKKASRAFLANPLIQVAYARQNDEDAFMYIEAWLSVYSHSLKNADYDLAEQTFMTHPHRSLESVRKAMDVSQKVFSKKEALDQDERLWTAALLTVQNTGKLVLEYSSDCEKAIGAYMRDVAGSA